MSLNIVDPKKDKLTKKIMSFLCSRKKELTVDISNLSLLEATSAALLNSTKCYVQNPDKKINWIVNKNVKNTIMPYKLDNMEILTDD